MSIGFCKNYKFCWSVVERSWIFLIWIIKIVYFVDNAKENYKLCRSCEEKSRNLSMMRRKWLISLIAFVKIMNFIDRLRKCCDFHWSSLKKRNYLWSGAKIAIISSIRCGKNWEFHRSDAEKNLEFHRVRKIVNFVDRLFKNHKCHLLAS